MEANCQNECKNRRGGFIMRRIGRFFLHILFTINTVVIIPVTAIFMFSDGTRAEKLSHVDYEIDSWLNGEFFLLGWLRNLHNWIYSITLPWQRYMLILIGWTLFILMIVWKLTKRPLVRKRRSTT